MARRNKILIELEVTDGGKGLRQVALDSNKASEGFVKVSENARSADRSLKGASEQSSSVTKNFSKMAQSITGGLVPAYAALAANIFALGAAFRFIQNAIDFDSMLGAQASFAANTGVALTSVAQSLREASGQMLTFQKASELAAVALSRGLSSQQLDDLAVSARQASAVIGRDFEESLNRLIRGITTNRVQQLDYLGISIRVDDAMDAYAKTLGKVRSELTVYERTQSLAIAAQRELNKTFGEVEEEANQFQQLLSSLDIIIKRVTTGLVPAFQSLANIIMASTAGAIAVMLMLASSIFKSIFNTELLNQKVDDYTAAKKQSAEAAIASFKKELSGINQIRGAYEELNQVIVEDRAKAAEAILEQTKRQSIILSKIAGQETLGLRDQRNLAAAFKAAEAHYNEHGRVVRGIFHGVDIQVVRSFREAMEAKVSRANKAAATIRGIFRTMQSSIVANFAIIRTVWAKTMGGLVTAARVAGRAINLAFRAIGIIGMISLLYQTVREFMANIHDFVMSALTMLDNALNSVSDYWRGVIGRALRVIDKAFGWLIDLAGKFSSHIYGIISNVFGLLGRLPGRFGKVARAAAEMTDKAANTAGDAREIFQNAIEAIEDVDNVRSNLAGAFEGSNLGAMTLELQESNAAARDAAKFVDQIKDSIGSISTDIRAMAREGGLPGVAKVSALASLGLGELAGNIKLVEDEAKRNELERNFLRTIEMLGNNIPEVAEAIRDAEGDFDALASSILGLENRARSGTATLTEFENSLESMSNIMLDSSRLDVFQMRAALEQAERLAAESSDVADSFNVTRNFAGELATVLGQSSSELRDTLEGFIRTERELKMAELERELRQVKIADLAEEQQIFAEKQLEIEEKIAEIKQLQYELDKNAFQLARSPGGTRTDELEAERDLLLAQLRIREQERDIFQRRYDSGVDLFPDFDKSLESLADTFSKATTLDISQLGNALDELERVTSEAETLAQQMGVVRDFAGEINEELGVSPEYLRDMLRDFATVDEALRVREQERLLHEQQIVRLGEVSRSEAQKRLDIEEKLLQIKRLQRDLDEVSLLLSTSGADSTVRGDLEARQRGILSEIALRQSELANLEETIFDLSRIRQSVVDSTETGMESAFSSIIKGTESVKDAFANMAISILESLADVIARLMVVKLLESSIGASFGFSSGNIPSVPRVNDLTTNRPIELASGGIVSGPRSGYPAILHGTEAVIPMGSKRPLPDGFGGSSEVNVYIDSTSGNAQVEGDQQLASLGAAIGRAVQREIQNQKRPGGSLSPYGVS